MKPELCETCAAGGHRAACPTFPRPCEDLIEIWEESREATIWECASAIGSGVLIRGSAKHFAKNLLKMLTPPSTSPETNK